MSHLGKDVIDDAGLKTIAWLCKQYWTALLAHE